MNIALTKRRTDKFQNASSRAGKECQGSRELRLGCNFFEVGDADRRWRLNMSGVVGDIFEGCSRDWSEGECIYCRWRLDLWRASAMSSGTILDGGRASRLPFSEPE